PDGKATLELIAADNQFAERFDLTRFGGPWTAHLGLGHSHFTRPRFAIAKPTQPKTDTPDVTVLIPSYQHSKYIGKTLRSVLGQSYPEFRIHVADDCSKDKTVGSARRVKDDRI